ncbi:MAG: hypothetical protein ACD_35C00310G0005 [uncultured bacterium]|nr:MAG: hypothetical protein ACD_35C00310G0005 [uncultured bacterium]
MHNSKKLSIIELLSCDAIRDNGNILADIVLLQKGLYKEIGWHYYVDLIWIVNRLRENEIYPGSTILDAGAGNGLLQYLLSLYGYNVISIDFSPRKISLLAKLVFPFEIMQSSVEFESPYINHIRESGNLRNKFLKLWSLIRSGNLGIFAYARLFIKVRTGKDKPGRIIFHQSDMQNIKSIDDSTIDAVVSVSAIEHMEIGSVKLALNEFRRVLKTNQPIILTTSASKSDDWFHQPSAGWCFSYETLAEVFRLAEKTVNEFSDYDEMLYEYKHNSFILKHLASIYKVKNEPGKQPETWEPSYLPVGIVTYNE